MKICYLNYTMRPDTGAGRFGRELLAAVKRLLPGAEIAVLTSDASGFPGEIPALPLKRLKLAFSLPRVRAILRQCDIVHALDGFPYGAVAASSIVGLDKKLIITAIGTGALRPLERPFAGRLLRWAYRRANRVVAVSNYTKRELVKSMPELAVSVINHGVNREEFNAACESELAPEERAAIQKLRPYILSNGAFKPRKGFRHSLEAFSLLRKDYPNLRYVIVGSGDRARIERDIDRLGLRGAVEIFSGVPHPFLVSLYRSAELFCLLPVEDRKDVEGFGLVFLEAAACGIPVVGAAGSGAGDAVSGGENGFLVPPGDPEAAARAMADIMRDPAKRAAFSAGSIAFAGRMSWERAAEGYAEIYAELAAAGDSDDRRVPPAVSLDKRAAARKEK